MKTSRSTALGKGCLLLLSMSLWAAAAQAAECRHPIPLLGGSTAIYRGADIDTVPALQDALVRYKETFRQIFERAGLRDSYDEAIEKMGAMTEKDIITYGQGAQFDWMAYRRKSDKHVSLLRKSCWEGTHEMRGWTFTLRVKDQDQDRDRTFVIPVTCLNLALLPLPKGELSCDLTAHIDCSSSPSKVTLTATPRATGEARIDQVEFTQVEPSGGGQRTVTKPPYEATFELSDSGSYSAVAVDNRNNQGIKSTACKAQVAVCTKPPIVWPSCETPPSCQLTATGSWPDGKGDLAISLAGSTGDHFKVEITGPETYTLDPTDPNVAIQQPVSQPGEYTVKLTATFNDARCRQSVCTTKVNLQPPPPPCCDSPWLLRTYAAYAESQGSHQEGLLRTANNEIGAFKFGFNEGLGAGLELEWLLAGRPRKDAKWGWTLGLFRADLNTIWQLDTPTHWVRDKDRVPMLTLTTGVNYHWGGPKWDFFLGPVIGYSHFDDGTYADTSLKPGTFRANFDDSFVYGGNIGFDGFLGKCWGITGGVEYLKAATKADFLDVNVDPLIIRAGFVYHF